MSGIAITFPSSPVEGQSYLAQNGFTYIYDSLKNRWKRGGEFVRAPKVLSYAGVAATTTGSGITTGPTGSLIYVVPGTVNPNSTVGVDSYKAYRASDSYPNYTEVQVSISSAFSTIAYAATFTGTTHTIPPATLSGNTTYYLRARQFVGSNASAASTGAISGYSANPVRFTSASVFLDAPTIVSIAGTTRFPVYQIGFAGTTLPATVTYTGGGLSNLDRVEWRVTGPRVPTSTGDTALAEVGVGTFSSATLANALVLAMPFSGATGVGITNDVNSAIRTASGASAGTTKTFTVVGGASTISVGTAQTAHFYQSAANFVSASGQYLSSSDITDFNFGTGDFTIECWVYHTNSGSNEGYTDTATSISSGGSGQWYFYKSSSDKVFWGQHGAGPILTSSTSISPKVWTHVAVSRTGSIVRMFVNGIMDGSATSSINFNNGGTLKIGGIATPYYLNGYIQDLKIYKGLAKYQENFTPPLPTYGTISYTTGDPFATVGVATTAFFESTGDTPTAEVAIGSSTAAQVASSLVLAMPMNRTFGFQDINVAIRGLTSGASAGTAKTVGLGTTSTANAPSQPIISSTESKWYDGAAYFTVGDYATIFSDTDFDFGSSPFTMEAWIYPVSGTAQILVFDWRPGNTTGIALINADGALAYWNYPTNVASTGKVQFNAWNHCAWVFSSSTVNFYINGIFAGSGSASVAQPDSSTMTINAQSQGTFYIQDAKIYKGFAKYTANFTPPRPICGFTTDISTQTGFTTTTATGALLSSVVGLGSTSTLAFSADLNLAGVTSITSSSGITTLPDPYAQNLVLALPLANITGVGNSFTNDRNTQIRSVSITGAGVTAGTTKTITNNSGVSTVAITTTTAYSNTAYFNGSNYLSALDNDLAFGTGDFTVECWIYAIAANDDGIYESRLSDGNATGFTLTAFSSTVIRTFSSGILISVTVEDYLNKWTHVSVSRRSNVSRIYVNGILRGSAVDNSNYTDNRAYIGSGVWGSSFFNGYIRDFKIYKGLGKYTTDFTPPPPMFGDYTRSTPNKVIFTPGSDYVLEARNTSGIVTSNYSATRQWGTKPKGGIYDPYGANLVLAIPGGAVGGAATTVDVTGQIKYETPTATYVNAGIVTYSNSLGIGTYGNKSTTSTNVSISSTIGKFYGTRSMRFDGSGFLTVSNNGDFNFGSNNFTIELWIYANDTSTCDILGYYSGGGFGLMIGNPYGLGPCAGSVTIFTDTAGGDVLNAPCGTVSANVWTHLAAVRNGSTLSIYKDGLLVVSKQTSATAYGTAQDIGVGKFLGSLSRNVTGYITDLRVYKGVAKYTSNFTPPNQIYLT